jgi:integrase/recombinase XerC
MTAEIVNMLIGGHVAYCQRRNYRPTTITQRRERLRHYEAHAGPLTAATRDNINTYLDQWPDPSTRGTYLSHLRAFYRWANTEGILTNDPTAGVERPRIPRRLPRPISEPDLRRALDAATPRVRCWLLLAAYAGLRACEIAPMRGEHINLGPPAVLFIPCQKGGDESAVPLAPIVVDALSAFPSRGPLWSAHELSRHHVSRTVVDLFTELGIEGGLHRGRHRFGTRFLEASGFDLRATAEAMRHRSPQTTMGYTLVAPDRLAGIVARIA